MNNSSLKKKSYQNHQQNRNKLLNAPLFHSQNSPYNTETVQCYSRTHFNFYQNTLQQQQQDDFIILKFHHNFIQQQSNFDQEQLGTKRMLRINRQNNQIDMINQSTFKQQIKKHSYSKKVFSAFLGVFKVVLNQKNQQNNVFQKACQNKQRNKQYCFLVFCDQAQKVCSLQGMNIFQISTLCFMNVFHEKEFINGFKNSNTYSQNNHSHKKQVYKSVQELRALLSFGFYFSYQYILTQTYGYQNYGQINTFTWNQMLLKPLEESYVDPQWKVPIIQGFVESFKVKHNLQIIQYVLISRRSTYCHGTSYFSAGIDENGHVANFVDTEQIIKIGSYIFADLQVRGTVPVIYSIKSNISSSMHFQEKQDFQKVHSYFLKHFQKLKTKYFNIFCVNLLSKQNKNEEKLLKEFQSHIKRIEDNEISVKYFHFDFKDQIFQKCINNNETSKTVRSYQQIDIAVQKVKQMKQNLKFYVYDCKKNKLILRPSGVFRINCFQSLEKTSIFQSRLALCTFQQILELFQLWSCPIQMTDCSNIILEDEANKRSSLYNYPLIKQFHKIWDKNSRMLSYHYTGVYFQQSGIQILQSPSPNFQINKINSQAIYVQKLQIQANQTKQKPQLKPQLSFNLHSGQGAYNTNRSVFSSGLGPIPKLFHNFSTISNCRQSLISQKSSQVASHIASRKHKDIGLINPKNPESIHLMNMIDVLFNSGNVKNLKEEYDRKSKSIIYQKQQNIFVTIISMKHFKDKIYKNIFLERTQNIQREQNIQFISNKTDILAISLQQVELTYGIKILQEIIDSKFKLLDSQYTTDNLLAVFIRINQSSKQNCQQKINIEQKITCIEKTSLNLSSKSFSTNTKSASIIRIGYQHNLITFVSCQFGFGSGQNKRKFNQQTMIHDLRQIHAKAFQNHQSNVYNKSLSIMNDDAVFIFGNIYKSKTRKFHVKEYNLNSNYNNKIDIEDRNFFEQPNQKTTKSELKVNKKTAFTPIPSYQNNNIQKNKEAQELNASPHPFTSEKLINDSSLFHNHISFNTMTNLWLNKNANKINQKNNQLKSITELQKNSWYTHNPNQNQNNKNQLAFTKEAQYITQKLLQYRQYYQRQITFQKQPQQLNVGRQSISFISVPSKQSPERKNAKNKNQISKKSFFSSKSKQCEENQLFEKNSNATKQQYQKQKILSIQRILYSTQLQVKDFSYELRNKDANQEQACVIGQFELVLPIIENICESDEYEQKLRKQFEEQNRKSLIQQDFVFDDIPFTNIEKSISYSFLQENN